MGALPAPWWNPLAKRAGGPGRAVGAPPTARGPREFESAGWRSNQATPGLQGLDVAQDVGDLLVAERAGEGGHRVLAGEDGSDGTRGVRLHLRGHLLHRRAARRIGAVARLAVGLEQGLAAG